MIDCAKLPTCHETRLAAVKCTRECAAKREEVTRGRGWGGAGHGNKNNELVISLYHELAIFV